MSRYLKDEVEVPGLTEAEENEVVREALIARACRTRRVDQEFINRRAATAAGRDLMFSETLEEVLKRVFKSGWTVPRPYRGAKARHTERMMSIILSDDHFGAQLDPEEVPIGYGSLAESRRLGKVVLQVADYKRPHRKETRLSVKLLGDMFQNQLHDQREGRPLTEQFAAMVQYIIQALFFWIAEYQFVDVYCVPGNHGRNKARHFDRAIQQKWDALETMAYLAIKYALEAAKVPNIRFHIEKRPYIIEEIFDKKAFWTHGDTVLKPGYPGRSINMANLYQQICRWNAARRVNGPFHLFGVGHVHIGSQTMMPGGIAMLTNGCLIPPDPYALANGAADVTCGQWMFESVRGFVLGDVRFINVDDADDEAGYNDVVRPFVQL